MKKKEYVVDETVELITMGDCYAALLAGKLLQFKSQATIVVSLRNGMQYDEYNSFYKDARNNFTFGVPSQWQVVKEKEVHWYDNIPECGVLCWCEDTPGITFIAAIIGYDEVSGFLEVGGVARYRKATPSTKEELLQFLAFYEK